VYVIKLQDCEMHSSTYLVTNILEMYLLTYFEICYWKGVLRVTYSTFKLESKALLIFIFLSIKLKQFRTLLNKEDKFPFFSKTGLFLFSRIKIKWAKSANIITLTL
jgi:hypothetical protein